MSDDAAANLARNLRQLRELRSLTQQRLATQSGVPRPTLANLESGSANPTLSVLIRIANALQVSIEELIGPPRAVARLYRADELPIRHRGHVAVRQLLPDPIPGIVFERLELEVGARMSGIPHKPGTREYLACERGSVQLAASGEVYTLVAGDVVVFRGDQRHGYANLADAVSVAYSVVMPAH